jgi:hypothetical protein
MNPPRFRTADFFYPCPFGQTNDAPYQNRDEAECGNGTIDLGEDCDAGGGYGEGPIPLICDEVGQGPGSLACRSECTYDASGCAAQTCGRYGSAVLRVSHLGPPGGDDELDLVLNDLDGAGRSFDPTLEETSLVIREDPLPPAAAELYYQRTIPAGSGWTATPTSLAFADPAANPSALRLTLTAQSGFDGPFRTVAHIRNGSLASIVGARTGTVVLRIGDDCWRGEFPCDFTRTGRSGSCRRGRKP